MLRFIIASMLIAAPAMAQPVTVDAKDLDRLIAWTTRGGTFSERDLILEKIIAQARASLDVKPAPKVEGAQ